MTGNRSEPFFHRRESYRLIRDLSVPDDWTIYLGSGATVDRTGLSWDLLVDRLLTRFESDPTARRHIIERYGCLGAATMVHQMYESLPDGDGQLYEDIRRLLYGGHGHMNGQMLGNVVDFAISLAEAGHSVTLITPNYDDYLAYELVLRQLKVGTEFVFHGDAEGANKGVPGTVPISCQFIHGFLPRKDFPDKKIGSLVVPPVFSEPQYFDTYQRSLDALSAAFLDRNVMLAGTSIVDAPLVNSLLATKGSKTRRYALLPLQADQFRTMDGRISDDLIAWNTRRLKSLEVAPIYPDYFGQTGQFVHEVQQCLVHGDRDMMTKRVSPRRYGTRLVTWWNLWKSINVDDPQGQARHHKELFDCVDRLRAILEAQAEENLKLEVWVRWYPESSQQLGLWASSVGTWADTWSMRLDTIAQDSQYRAVRVFCAGAPQFMAADETSSDRWRTYLATPIWQDHQGTGIVPVGVISLASMNEGRASSVGPHNLGALDAALEEMRQVGASILSIES